MFKMIFSPEDLNDFDKQFYRGVEIRWGGLIEKLDTYYQAFKTYLIAAGFDERTIDDYFMREVDDGSKDCQNE